MNIVRLYNCPYCINGECSFRPDNNLEFGSFVSKFAVTHCPAGRKYCYVDVDTDKWSKGTLEIIRILVKGWRRTGNGNAGEIIDVIEQILRRQDDMATICMTTKQFEEEKQRAREEVWDLTQRINLLPDVKEGAYGIDDLGEAFGTCDWSKVLLMPVEEALKKDKAYQEDKKALHIGDEVEFVGSNPNYKVKVNELMTGYVVGFEDGLSSTCYVRILTKKHGTYVKSREMCEKTGKHNHDIEKVMASFEKGES